MNTKRVLLRTALAVLLAGAGIASGAAQQRLLKSGDNVLFQADELRHDQELGIVTATGHVEVVQGERILRADTVSYNQKADLVTATGNIALLEPTGEVVFADHVELSGDLKNGTIRNLRMLLADNARFAAASGRRVGGNVTELDKAVYSPCRTCVRPGGPPLWQIKAVKVTHNQAEKLVEYRDAWLEFAGIPVAYTPYLSHPDPTVKRKSGFLSTMTPSYGTDSQLGVIVETPYYFDIAPDKDATFRPIITTKEGPVLAGEYRQRFAHGVLRTDLSGTYGSADSGKDKFRGHFFGETRFDLGETWRGGADLQLASDDTYLRRYKFNSLDKLTNHVFVEGFRGRNYAQAEGYFWRGLRQTDDPGKTPLVMPLINYNHVGLPGRYGGHWVFDANLMSLTEGDGPDSQRLSLRTGWELPYIARTGEVYLLYADLRTDAYWVNDVQEPTRPAGDLSSGLTGRVTPRLGLDWRFPFARTSTTTTQIIEPVAGIAISPNGGNPDKIPNEDSQDFDLDDTNLLSRDRFPGLDRVEGGLRAYYGLKLGVAGASGSSSAFIGQAYRLRNDSTFAPGSGLSDNLSDIVGRVTVQPKLPMYLQYRFRFDKSTFRAQRNEVIASVGPKAFNVSLDYAFLNQAAGSGEFGNREELSAGVRSQITPEWSASAATRRDLERDQSLSYNFGLKYECDCFTFTIDYQRTFTIDRDIRPSESVFVRLIFKTLGSVETSTRRTPSAAIAQPGPSR